MQPGKLSEIIAIQSLSATQSASGAQVQSWATTINTRANLRSQSGLRRNQQAIISDSDISTVIVIFRIRRRPGVTDSMRIVNRSLIYDIKACVPTDKRDFIDLHCEKVS